MQHLKIQENKVEEMEMEGERAYIEFPSKEDFLECVVESYRR